MARIQLSPHHTSILQKNVQKKIRSIFIIWGGCCKVTNYIALHRDSVFVVLYPKQKPFRPPCLYILLPPDWFFALALHAGGFRVLICKSCIINEENL